MVIVMKKLTLSFLHEALISSSQHAIFCSHALSANRFNEWSNVSKMCFVYLYVHTYFLECVRNITAI